MKFIREHGNFILEQNFYDFVLLLSTKTFWEHNLRFCNPYRITYRVFDFCQKSILGY